MTVFFGGPSSVGTLVVIMLLCFATFFSVPRILGLLVHVNDLYLK